MGKDTFVYFMIVVDLIVVIVSIWFINWLNYRTKQYAEVFDSVNVEMRDFVLCFGNLPNDHIFGGKDMMLQCQLWSATLGRCGTRVRETMSNEERVHLCTLRCRRINYIMLFFR